MRDRKNSALSKPTAVLFDWDNTLVDTWPVIAACMNETLTRMGQAPWSDQEVRQRVGKSLRDTFPALFGDRWEEAGDIYLSTFKSVHLERLRVLDHAERAVQLVAAAGLPCALVSNKTGPHLRTEVTHLGWDKYFSAIVGATDAPKDKPAPDPVHMALEGSQATAGPGVWFVGDTPTDMHCARNAGCTAVLIHQDTPEITHFGEAMPDVHVVALESWAELFQDML